MSQQDQMEGYGDSPGKGRRWLSPGGVDEGEVDLPIIQDAASHLA